MTTLWWVRHGPTHARGMIGWTDLPADLSDIAAVARLDAALPQVPVISSTLSRAVATARVIAGMRPRLPPDPDLRELHFGAWETRRHDDIETEDPQRLRSFWEQPGDNAPLDGESWDTLRSRVGRATDRLLARNQDLIVVAHFGPILTQYQRARGIATTEAFGQKIDPLSVTELSFDGEAWEVGRVNYRP